ncbi:MAG: hypothetical protein ACI841_001992 [Planctomycetota bacterium]|jgi:hypothetical protein
MNAPSRLLLILTLIASVSCQSSQKVSSEPLPFRVALIPVATGKMLPGEVNEDYTQTEFKLALNSERISKLLNESLDKRAFTSSILLDIPATRDASFSTGKDKGINRALVQAAIDAGADLILRPVLRYDPTIYTATNDRFWPNVLLFLMGGPMTWTLNDRSYYLDAQLDTEVYDLGPFRNNPDTTELGNLNFRIADGRGKLNEVALDFIDRADGNIGSYALSMLIPSGFLSKETEAVKARLEVEAVERLSEEIVQSIHENRDVIIRAENIASWYMPEVNRKAGRLSGYIMLETGADVDRMQSVAVYDGQNRTPIDIDTLEAGGTVMSSGKYPQLRYEFSLPIPAEYRGKDLRVVATDSAQRSRGQTVAAKGIREAVFKASDQE